MFNVSNPNLSPQTSCTMHVVDIAWARSLSTPITGRKLNHHSYLLDVVTSSRL